MISDTSYHLADGVVSGDAIPEIGVANARQKLQTLGWQPDGEYRNVGYYWNYFKKDDFRLELHIDDYLGTVYDPPDYSQTGISRIVIKAPNNR